MVIISNVAAEWQYNPFTDKLDYFTAVGNSTSQIRTAINVTDLYYDIQVKSAMIATGNTSSQIISTINQSNAYYDIVSQRCMQVYNTTYQAKADYNFGSNDFSGTGDFVTTGDVNATRVFVNGNKLTKPYDVVICRTIDTGCDVVCSDDDCSDEIQGAINSIASSIGGNGGRIYIKNGTYPLNTHAYGDVWNTSILMDNKDNIQIIGANRDAVRLVLNSGQDGTTIYYNYSDWITLSDFTIDESNTINRGIDGQACIKGAASNGNVIKDIKLANCGCDGFYPTNCQNSRYENILVQNANHFGIVLDSETISTIVNPQVVKAKSACMWIAGGSSLEDAYITILGGVLYNCTWGEASAGVYISAAKGVTMQGTTITYAGLQTGGNRTDGILIKSSQGIIIDGVQIINTSRAGILPWISNGVTITNSYILNPRIDGVDGAGSGIYILASNYTYVSGNVIEDRKATPSMPYGIVEDSNSYNNNIQDNVVLNAQTGNVGITNSYSPIFKYTTLPSCTTSKNNVFTNKEIIYNSTSQTQKCLCSEGTWKCTFPLNSTSLTGLTWVNSTFFNGTYYGNGANLVSVPTYNSTYDAKPSNTYNSSYNSQLGKNTTAEVLTAVNSTDLNMANKNITRVNALKFGAWCIYNSTSTDFIIANYGC